MASGEGVRRKMVMMIKDILALASNIKFGVGVGVVSTSFQSGNPSLVQCFELPEGTGSVVWLLVNPTAYKRPEVKAFFKFLPQIHRVLSQLLSSHFVSRPGHSYALQHPSLRPHFDHSPHVCAPVGG